MEQPEGNGDRAQRCAAFWRIRRLVSTRRPALSGCAGTWIGPGIAGFAAACCYDASASCAPGRPAGAVPLDAEWPICGMCPITQPAGCRIADGRDPTLPRSRYRPTPAIAAPQQLSVKRVRGGLQGHTTAHQQPGGWIVDLSGNPLRGPDRRGCRVLSDEVKVIIRDHCLCVVVCVCCLWWRVVVGVGRGGIDRWRRLGGGCRGGGRC